METTLITLTVVDLGEGDKIERSSSFKNYSFKK